MFSRVSPGLRASTAADKKKNSVCQNKSIKPLFSPFSDLFVCVDFSACVWVTFKNPSDVAGVEAACCT